MALPIFPHSHYPDILLEGLVGQEAESVIETTMDSGHVETLEIFLDSPDYYQCEIVMSGSKLKDFRYWFKYIINNGQAWFMFEVPDEFDDTTLSECRIRGKPARDKLSSANARIGQDSVYRISFTLEVREPRYESEADYNRNLNPTAFDWADNGDFSGNGDWIGIPRP